MSTFPLIALLGLATHSSAHSPVIPSELAITPPPLVTPLSPKRADDKGADRTQQAKIVLDLMHGDEAQKASAASQMEAHPELVDPFQFARLVSYLWQHGDRARATFWYYFWEQRSRPWAKLGAIDGERAARAAIIETLGSTINGWAGSDLPAERALRLRAVSYEGRMPLFNAQPDGINKGDWLEMIAKDRAANGPERVRRLFPVDNQSLAFLAEERQRNGLYNGPWKDSGQPVPDEWR